jgi:hypothetical protein
MIRKVVYFSMQVPNRPGVGVEMLKSIAKGRQNLLAFTGFPNGGGAQVDFVPARPVEFARGAKKAGARLSKRKTAFLVQGEDRVGGAGARSRRTGEGEDQHGRDGRGDRRERPVRRDFLGQAQGRRTGVAAAARKVAPLPKSSSWSPRRAVAWRLAQPDAGQIVPERRSEIPGKPPGDEDGSDDGDEVLGDFDPEMTIDHGNVGSIWYVVSIDPVRSKGKVG